MTSKFVVHAFSMLLVAAGSLASGCATTGQGTEDGGETAAEMEQDKRRIPPEVTDHTVHDVEGPVVRPTVDVEMEFDGMRGVDRRSIETRVSQQTVRCYRAALRNSRQLEGTMVYEVVVMRSGFVVGSDVMSTAIKHREMSACVERTFERLRFDVDAENRPVYRVMVRLDFTRETVMPEEVPIEARNPDT